MDEMDSAWRETTGTVICTAAWDQQSTPQTVSSRAAVSVSDQPATDREFITLLTPCLQLVAPSGMKIDERDTWFEAARIALADVPAHLLRRGVKHAMKVADHPSKIVAAITAEIGPAMRERRASNASAHKIWQGASLPAPGRERPTASELEEICKRYGVGRFAKLEHQDRADRHDAPGSLDPDRPCRAPTRADYIRLFGVDPGEAA